MTMRKTDAVVRILLPEIAGKEILEVACGTGDFSLSASAYAKAVYCIDLDESRLSHKIKKDNITFRKMDASRMSFPDGKFDTIFIYNAFFHIQSQWTNIEKECRRVLRPNGSIYIIGTWKLDTSLLTDMFGEQATWQGNYCIVRIT